MTLTKQPLDVSYDVAEVDGLTEARRLVSGLESQVVYCHPAWKKLYNVKNYLDKRAQEVLADVLADPEVRS